jgi:hypothetical protein
MSRISAEFVSKKYLIFFLKTSTSLQGRVAAETHLADGKFCQVAVKKEFIKSCGRNRTPEISNNNNNNNNKLTDVAIPTDRNFIQREAEKKLKYDSLGIEIQRMLNLKWSIMPVIIGATGMVTKGLRKNLEATPGKHSIDSLQQTAVLGTSHIMRKLEA